MKTLHSRGGGGIRSLISIIAVLTLSFTTAVTAAWEKNQPMDFSIEAKPLAEALMQFGVQSDTAIVVPSRLTQGKTGRAVQGTMPPAQALDTLLQNTGLGYSAGQDGTVTIIEVSEYAGGRTAAVQVDTAAEQGAGNESKPKYIEEVIVTATKRETSIQDTAMSITALGSEEIERRGLVSLTDYLNSVPSASVLEQSPGHASVVLRGVAATAQRDGRTSGPTTGVYFGETPISGLGGDGQQPDIKLADMERVEVLRGPQGTLYGASNLAGTVRYIPKEPSLEEFEGYIKGGFSSTTKFGGDNTEVQGVLNIPIVEGRFAIRAVGYRYDNSGYYRNLGASDPEVAAGVAAYGAAGVEKGDIGASEYVGGRISALWKPVDELSINLTYLHQEIDQDGWGSSDLPLGEGSYLQRRYQVTTQAPVIVEPNLNEKFADNTELLNATIEYDFGWASLTSSTSSVVEKISFTRDLGFLFFGGIPSTNESQFENKSFAQEVRLATSNEGPFQIVGGIYFEDIKRETVYWNGFGGDPALNPFGEYVLAAGLIGNDTQQKAAFGELSYQLTNELKVTTGARIFSYDRTSTNSIEGGTAFIGVDNTTVIKSDASDNIFKAMAEYTPNDDALFYLSWSEGFRYGSPLDANVNPVCDADNDGIYDGSNGISTGPRALDSDFVDNYEVGGKVSLLDGRFNINADIFQMDWEGIPVLVAFSGACATQLNAGEARSRGAELDGSLALTDGLLFNFGASYVDAELTKDAPSIGLAGDRLPGAPKYNFNLGLQYDFLVVGYDAYARGDYYYVGGFYNNLQETGQEAGDYGLLGLQTGIELKRVSVEIFARNVTNEDGYTWIDLDSLASNQLAYQLRPRTIGINLRYSF